MTGTLSLLGLLAYKPNLFDALVLPAALDRDTLVHNLTLECAELEMLYPSPDMMGYAIFAWSVKESPIWEKLYQTTQLEYNPIHNYDRTEEWTDDTTRTPDLNTHGVNSGTDVTQTEVSAFDSNAFTPREKTTVQPGSVTDVQTSGTEKTIVTRTGKASGNIGVTTTQQMIEAERNVVKFNIYDYIIDEFKHRFCLLVY